ncbi:MAG: type III pantothenate kinase [Spirochaetia bacterium]|nr:type III pantothenate kinase [Spirochaetota bacterium]MCX8096863.1 type III pantothenate kinase [Spirochaetota bacterium]MDW8112980.1 type III pantothenate kinase [Spirochaetia bacterium]
MSRKVLCIDIGNTNVVFGISTDDWNNFEFKHFRITTNHLITIDEVSLNLFSILNYFDVRRDEIFRVVISSVVPEVDVQFRYGILNVIGVEPVFVKPEDTGIRIEYNNINEIGSDRLVDALAGKVLYGSDCIIVDTGTATTIDVLRDGAYLGGVIMPGIQTSLYAIFQKASKIPKISLDTPKRVVGKTTEECLRSGIILGLAKGIEGVINEIFKELNYSNFKVIFTGGLSDKIFELVNISNKFIDKELMLKGLKLIASRLES